MKLLIEVTQKDIEEGVEMDCKSCPVALACMRQIDKVPGALYVVADSGMISFRNGLKQQMAMTITPDFVARFMHRFDAGITVHPFAFEADFHPEFVGMP